MKVERDQYEAWQRRWSEIDATVTDKNDNWVGAVTAFMHQIEDARHDAYLTGLARAARQRASEFKKLKRNAVPSDVFQTFLNAWGRVQGGIGMHLMDRPPT
ncbi:hypothetical protein IVB14_24455 [Bradyrhizobium sp. 180]|uniref:hypothetical protein n=1 Tax=unclassified Bradyrhizobium TaxID=2631580 RepID=UPI001FF8E299|nr:MULTISPECIES: hypothetical protein [unclassified Bradyrhizobium]MCK1493489.1 hypothetical protein [Bradyrhizobium sp. 180]MCK1754128.1 hypothetical protein [Bradyrhizobium sp. 137]